MRLQTTELVIVQRTCKHKNRLAQVFAICIQMHTLWLELFRSNEVGVKYIINYRLINIKRFEREKKNCWNLLAIFVGYLKINISIENPLALNYIKQYLNIK